MKTETCPSQYFAALVQEFMFPSERTKHRPGTFKSDHCIAVGVEIFQVWLLTNQKGIFLFK